VAREREGEGDGGVEVGTAADVADGVDPKHDHQPEGDRDADVAELLRLRVDHDRAEDERERPDRLRRHCPQQLAAHAAAAVPPGP
jgi:hypothetical protein